MTEAIETKAHYVPPGAIEMPDGTTVFRDAKGGYLPISTIGVQDQMEDELVRSLIERAAELSQMLTAFKADCMAQIGGFNDILADEYGAKRGGRKGNMTFRTVDALLEIEISQADRIEFGPQLQIGKQLVDECLNGWANGSAAELRTIVTHAFSVDKEGQINKSALFMLLRLKIEGEQWNRAMDAIRDSIRVVGSKGYVRFYRRDAHDGERRAVTLDIAKA